MKYDIYINSSIGWPFSADYVRHELQKSGDGDVNVYLSSLGGSVVDAFQIRQMFVDHGHVTIYMHGCVASAATILATGAWRIVMGEFALYLMHPCSQWVDTWGQMNADELADAIRELEAAKGELETIDHTVASIYAARSGQKVDDVAAWMKEARWLTAAECLERGLVDDTCSDEAPAALSDSFRAKVAACGLPVPPDSPAKRNSRSLLDSIKALFAYEAEDDNQDVSPNSLSIMFENQPNIQAVLKKAGLEAAKDGEAQPTAEQLTALDKHLAELSGHVSALEAEKRTLTDEKAQLDTKVNDLTAQVEALQKTDGEETQAVAGKEDDEPKDYAARARASYGKLKNLA